VWLTPSETVVAAGRGKNVLRIRLVGGRAGAAARPLLLPGRVNDRFDCFAQRVDDQGRTRPLQLVNREGDGTVARCTWSIRSGTSGQDMGGILAIERNGVTYYRGLDYVIQ